MRKGFLLFLCAVLWIDAAATGYTKMQTPGAAAKNPRTKPARQISNLDFFTTISEGTYFDFTGEFALPAGFFDRGSDRFEGRVQFKGIPIQTFQDYKVGDTDSIVERKSMPKLRPPFPSRGTIKVELVELSLASVQPIQIRIGKRIQRWNVKLLLSSQRPSSGEMTIVQENERGGVFNSEFRVFPVLKFERLGDGAERALDVGKMNPGPEGAKNITLHAESVPWETRPPKDSLRQSGGFFAGVKGGQPVQMNHGKHRTRYSEISLDVSPL